MIEIPKIKLPYDEGEVPFEFEGRTFVANGAIVTPEKIIAYPKENGVLGDCKGKPIGTWEAVSTWKTPRSWVSSTMSQIEATVNGVVYTGRGAGENMLFKGKLKKSGG